MSISHLSWIFLSVFLWSLPSVRSVFCCPFSLFTSVFFLAGHFFNYLFIFLLLFVLSLIFSAYIELLSCMFAEAGITWTLALIHRLAGQPNTHTCTCTCVCEGEFVCAAKTSLYLNAYIRLSYTLMDNEHQSKSLACICWTGKSCNDKPCCTACVMPCLSFPKPLILIVSVCYSAQCFCFPCGFNLHY